MKKYCYRNKISLLASILLFFCLKSKPTQASTLLFESSTINQLIPINSEFQTNKQYKRLYIPKIIKKEILKNDLSILLEEKSNIYDSKINIKLLILSSVPKALDSKSESTKLLKELSRTLRKLNWNPKININRNNSLSQPTVLLLSQVNNGNIYQNIYDFKISLIGDNSLKKLANKPKTKPEISELPKKSTNPDLKSKVTLQPQPHYYHKYVDRFKFTNNFTPKTVKLKSQTNLIKNSSSQINFNNIESLIESLQNPRGIAEKFHSLSQTEIQKYQVDIPSIKNRNFNVNNTKEQQELEQKLAEQREKLKRQRQQLKKELERQRKEREVKRKQQEEKLKQKIQEQLQKAQQKRQQEIQKIFR